MATLVAALVMGLMGSAHCIGMCGGFAAACARPRWSVLLWNAGRLTTYALLGAIGGLAGGAVPGPRWVPIVISLVLLVWFAAALAELVPQPKLVLPGLVRTGAALVRRQGPGSRYLFGLATGLLPCGMVYAALALAIAAGTPLLGAAAMVAFGLGNAPALTLLGAGVQRWAARGLWQRRSLALLVLLAGVWSIARRPPHALHHGPSDVPAAEHVLPHPMPGH